jgi:hypothetical protein
MRVSKDQLDRIHIARHEVAVAGVIAARSEMKKDFSKSFQRFAGDVDFAFSFGPDDHQGAYLFLKVCKGMKCLEKY